MTVNDTTAGRGYPLPHPDNRLSVDVARLREALSGIDGDMTALIALGLLSGQFRGSLTITGDLLVSGEKVRVDAMTLEVKDNTVTLNKGEPGSGVTAGSAGIDIDRGALPNYRLVFTEASQTFSVGQVGQEQPVATREDTPTDGAYARWSASENRFVSQTPDQLIASLPPDGMKAAVEASGFVGGLQADAVKRLARVHMQTYGAISINYLGK